MLMISMVLFIRHYLEKAMNLKLMINVLEQLSRRNSEHYSTLTTTCMIPLSFIQNGFEFSLINTFFINP